MSQTAGDGHVTQPVTAAAHVVSQGRATSAGAESDPGGLVPLSHPPTGARPRWSLSTHAPSGGLFQSTDKIWSSLNPQKKSSIDGGTYRIVCVVGKNKFTLAL